MGGGYRLSVGELPLGQEVVAREPSLGKQPRWQDGEKKRSPHRAKGAGWAEKGAGSDVVASVLKGSRSTSKGGCVDNMEGIAERANKTTENHSCVWESAAHVGPWSELFWCRGGGDTSNELRDIDSEKVTKCDFLPTLNVGFTAENLVVCMQGDRTAMDQWIGM